MKRLQIALMSMALAACASTPPAQVAEKPDVDRNCVRQTGSRIEKPEERLCQPGHVYTREDLERSGGISTGDALKRIGVR